MTAVTLLLSDRGEQHGMRRFVGDGHWWHLSLSAWRELDEPCVISIHIEGRREHSVICTSYQLDERAGHSVDDGLIRADSHEHSVAAASQDVGAE